MWTSTIVCTLDLVEEDTLFKEDVPQPFCGVTHIKVIYGHIFKIYTFF